MLGIECGAVSSDTLADHLDAGGFAALLVLPFSMLKEKGPTRRAWLLSCGDAVLLPTPSATDMAAAYAAILDHDNLATSPR